MMKKNRPICLILIGFGMLISLGGINGCSPTEDDDTDATLGQPIYLNISNQSQFEIQHVFVHGILQNYKEVPSILEKPLPVGESVVHRVVLNPSHVTVTRVKNKDGPLLAYTTGVEINITRSSQLEYYDTEFRLSDWTPPEGTTTF